MTAALNTQTREFPHDTAWVHTPGRITLSVDKNLARLRQKIADWQEAFNDIKLYEQGKKQLKSAQALLQEL